MISVAMRAIRAGAVLLAVVAFPVAASAQSPAHLKLAREAVDVSGAARTFDRVMGVIFQQTYTTFAQTNPDLSQELAGVMQALIPEFDKRKEEIADIVAQAYAAKFSEAELKELLAFYNSPIGRKVNSELANIMQDAFNKTQQWSGQVSQQLVDRVKAEMKKKGHNI
ncbi:MAG: DUF2059 domain-containing protein [Xanthobacteraceae bacterium]|nr:DUF2059 domain-containing protein [Xanthobacteraceae bacterium]QYK45853.1 MAG: DUF2059 domain-containing protein [Xanthobacteraceae bacterium]HMN51763.1 DUF2059 domain-containing protein [Xanthobacteraceae bacterium]